MVSECASSKSKRSLIFSFKVLRIPKDAGNESFFVSLWTYEIIDINVTIVMIFILKKYYYVPYNISIGMYLY